MQVGAAHPTSRHITTPQQKARLLKHPCFCLCPPPVVCFFFVVCLQHLPGLQNRQRDFLLEHLGSPKQQRQAEQPVPVADELVDEQQAAEEAAML